MSPLKTHIIMIDGDPVHMVRLCDHAEWRNNSERYQYLRDFHVLTWESQIGGPDTCSIDFEGEGHDLDAAIDNARGAQ